jgi:hypothetical protein
MRQQPVLAATTQALPPWKEGTKEQPVLLKSPQEPQCIMSQTEGSTGQTVDPPMTWAPSMPPIGCTEPRAPATTLESVPAAALTAADFYTHMSTIMANFSSTISEQLGQTIDANRESLWESTKLIHNEIWTMSKGLKADAMNFPKGLQTWAKVSLMR